MTTKLWFIILSSFFCSFLALTPSSLVAQSDSIQWIITTIQKASPTFEYKGLYVSEEKDGIRYVGWQNLDIECGKDYLLCKERGNKELRAAKASNTTMLYTWWANGVFERSSEEQGKGVGSSKGNVKIRKLKTGNIGFIISMKPEQINEISGPLLRRIIRLVQTFEE